MAKEKFTPQEVLDLLGDGTTYSKKEIADRLGCCPATVTNKIKTLRQDGEPIIHSNNGLSLILNKEQLEDFGKATETRDFVEWTTQMIYGIVRLAQPIKRYLPDMKRTLRISYTPDERKQLLKTCAKITALLIYANEQDDF